MKLTLMPLEHDHMVRVRCEGNIRAPGLSAANDPLQQLLGSHCFSHRVLVDLSSAAGIDTSGVAWLLRNTERFAQNGGIFVVIGIPPTVEQIVQVLKLEETLHCAANDEEAVQLARGELRHRLTPTSTRDSAPRTTVVEPSGVDAKTGSV